MDDLQPNPKSRRRSKFIIGFHLFVIATAVTLLFIDFRQLVPWLLIASSFCGLMLNRALLKDR